MSFELTKDNWFYVIGLFAVIGLAEISIQKFFPENLSTDFKIISVNQDNSVIFLQKKKFGFDEYFRFAVFSIFMASIAYFLDWRMPFAFYTTVILFFYIVTMMKYRHKIIVEDNRIVEHKFLRKAKLILLPDVESIRFDRRKRIFAVSGNGQKITINANRENRARINLASFNVSTSVDESARKSVLLIARCAGVKFRNKPEVNWSS